MFGGRIPQRRALLRSQWKPATPQAGYLFRQHADQAGKHLDRFIQPIREFHEPASEIERATDLDLDRVNAPSRHTVPVQNVASRIRPVVGSDHAAVAGTNDFG